MTTIAPNGSWKSPIAAEMLIGGGRRRLSELRCDGNDIYWLDGRPKEGGRQVIMRLSPDGEMTGPDAARVQLAKRGTRVRRGIIRG